ncbi:MAG: PilZ domain-containing protein [Proteobacteria bacterium]|nr:PilZ domain-containing protein [Pseudomonadota bacterium]
MGKGTSTKLDKIVANFCNERRNKGRETVPISGRVNMSGTEFPIMLLDLSANGAKFTIDGYAASPETGQQLELVITSGADAIGDMLNVMATVAHVTNGEIGVHFESFKAD